MPFRAVIYREPNSSPMCPVMAARGGGVQGQFCHSLCDSRPAGHLQVSQQQDCGEGPVG